MLNLVLQFLLLSNTYFRVAYAIFSTYAEVSKRALLLLTLVLQINWAISITSNYITFGSLHYTIITIVLLLSLSELYSKPKSVNNHHKENV